MKQDASKAQVKRPRQEEPPRTSNSSSTFQEPAGDSHLMGMHPSRRRRMLEGGRVDVPGNHTQPPGNHHQPAANYSRPQRNLPHTSRNYPQSQYQGSSSHQYQGNQPSSRSSMVSQNHQQRSYSQHMNSHNMGQQAHQAAQSNRTTRTPPPLSDNPHIMAGAGKFNAIVVPIPPEIFQPPPWLGRPSQQYCFEVFAGKELVNRFPIWKDKILVIGRQPDCNIVVNHVLVSRRHAIILFHEDSGELMVYDVGSTHGTFLNDMSGKIPENDGLLPRRSYVRVKLGWRIMFGKCAYQYSLVSDGPNPHWKPRAAPPVQPKKTGGGESTQMQGGGISQNQQVQQSTSSSKPLTGIARFIQHSAAARGMFDKTDR